MTPTEWIENAVMLTESAASIAAVGGYPDAPVDLAENQVLVATPDGLLRLTVEPEPAPAPAALARVEVTAGRVVVLVDGVEYAQVIGSSADTAEVVFLADGTVSYSRTMDTAAPTVQVLPGAAPAGGVTSAAAMEHIAEAGP